MTRFDVWTLGNNRAWLSSHFIGLRIVGWQLDLRTDAHGRFFSERQKGCGYRARVHWHRFGLCVRAIRLRPDNDVEDLDDQHIDWMRHIRKGGL